MPVTTTLIRADLKKAKGEPVIAVIYARYSSHSQTDQSIEGQLAAAHSYADAKGYTVVKEYCDRAQTGRNDNREAFQQMLADTDKKTFDVIITWKIDRIGRNREDLAFNKHRCKKNGVKIEYVAETLTDTPESIILEAVLEGMAEYYSVQLSANVKRGIRESAKKGLFHGGTVPLGYRIDDDKHYQIDPQAAPVVREIFKRYASGQTEFEIIEWLNQCSVKTSKKKPFGKSSLLPILHNEKYIGVYRFENIVHEDAIPAIIDKQTFDKVQERLKVNRRAPANRWTYTDFMLTGKLFCGHCGEMMVGVSGVSRNGKKYEYYDCRNHRKKECRKKPVRKDWIEKVVLEETVRLLNDDKLMETLIDNAWAHYQARETAQDERKTLEKSLSDINNAINNIMGAIEQGIYTASTKTRLNDLEQQRTDVMAKIAEYDLASGTSLRLTREHIKYYLMHFRDRDPETSNAEFEKRLVHTFISAVYVYDDGRLKLVFNYTENGSAKAITLKDLEKIEDDAEDDIDTEDGADADGMADVNDADNAEGKADVPDEPENSPPAPSNGQNSAISSENVLPLRSVAHHTLHGRTMVKVWRCFFIVTIDTKAEG